MNHKIKRSLAVLLAMVLLVSCAPTNTSDTSSNNPSSENSQVAASTTMEESTTESQTEKETTAESTEPVQVDEDAVTMGLELDHPGDLMYANNFDLSYYKDGYTLFSIGNEHKSKYLLVPEGKEVPANVPESVTVLQQPITKTHLSSLAITSYLDVIDALDNVVTTGSQPEEWYIPGMKERVDAGKIVFAGLPKEPDFEMLTEKGTQLVIDTTMLMSNPEIMEKYKELGIPLIIDLSAKENHPLGRVEWIKLMGAIYDKEEEADAFFADAIQKLESVVSKEKNGKSVAMFFVSMSKPGIAYARRAGDYMVEMIEMAGGKYIMPDLEPTKGGLAKVTYEDLYAQCADADYIFYLNYSQGLSSLEDLVKLSDLFKDFKAVKEGRIYVTPPSYTQDAVRVADMLTDMSTVLNDETVEETHFFTKLK